MNKQIVKRVAVEISKENLDALKELREKNGSTWKWLVNLAISQWLKALN